jgi:hypothetical protein
VGSHVLGAENQPAAPVVQGLLFRRFIFGHQLGCDIARLGPRVSP